MIGRVLAAASAAVALLAAEAAPGGALAAQLLSHRAVYELSLEYTSAESAITNAAGDLVFQIDDLCSAWSTVTEMRFAVLYDDGTEGRFGTYVAARESKDGTAYEFQVRRRSTYGRNEIIEGEAAMPADGGPGIARFTSPTERTMALPQGTLFPTLQSLAVIEDAREGRLQRYDTVFDGTEEESLYEVSSVVAAEVPSDVPTTMETPLLEGLASWRLGLAYYEVIDQSGLPSHESSLRFFENGVADGQLFDFGEFRLRARMVELGERSDPGC